ARRADIYARYRFMPLPWLPEIVRCFVSNFDGLTVTSIEWNAYRIAQVRERNDQAGVPVFVDSDLFTSFLQCNRANTTLYFDHSFHRMNSTTIVDYLYIGNEYFGRTIV